MVLKELEIQGFKSFPTRSGSRSAGASPGWWGPTARAKAPFRRIRWVLGETSSRQLRSAGKMEDVIFGGTRRRGAMGYASVRLTLDNTDHTLDLDAPEVTIGRRYYRSGDSEYTINGQACRLKDVYELLLDTGIGRDGYSIIGRAASPRSWPPRAASGGKFLKKPAASPSTATAAPRPSTASPPPRRTWSGCGTSWASWKAGVGPLAREAEKAKAYLELASRRKGLEVTLWVESIRAARAAMQQLQRDYETAQAALSAGTARTRRPSRRLRRSVCRRSASPWRSSA